MNKSPQYNQQSEPDQCKSEAEEMYSPKPRNWLSISLNTGAMLNNTSEESICEYSQIKLLHGTIKLLIEEVLTNNDASTIEFTLDNKLTL